jgi:hypothetical protein
MIICPSARGLFGRGSYVVSGKGTPRVPFIRTLARPNRLNRHNVLGRDVVYSVFNSVAESFTAPVDLVTGIVGTKTGPPNPTVSGIAGGVNGFKWGKGAVCSPTDSSGWTSGVPVRLSPYAAITLCMWVSFDYSATASGGILVETSAAFASNNGAFKIDPKEFNNGFHTVQAHNAGGTGGFDFPAGAGGSVTGRHWEHWAYYFDTRVAGTCGIQFFRNGVRITPPFADGVAWTAGNPFGDYIITIGSNGAANRYAAAMLRYFTIFGRLLSRTEIVSHMSNPTQVLSYPTQRGFRV